MPTRSGFRLGVLVLLTSVLVVGGWQRFAADPVAVIVQVSGTVQIQTAGGNSPFAATVGANLGAGDKLLVSNGARAVLLYKSGKMEPATSSLTITAPVNQAPAGRFEQTVKTLAQVATTNARAQPNRQGMIRPIAGEPVPVAPRNRVTVIDVRPTFVWYRVPGASGYTVQIRRIEPEGGRPERFEAGTDTSWTYPLSASPLMPGATYEWTVGAAGDRVAQMQRFRVISGDEFNQVANAMRELTADGIDPQTDGLFLSALTYRDAGLFYEAERALEKLAGAGGSGRMFHLLRAEVLDAIGNVDAAAKHFAAADTQSGN